MTTSTVTDAQVFEAMGCDVVRPHMFLECGCADNPHGRGGASRSIARRLPYVMSNPSSPEAWAAAPVLRQWVESQGWTWREEHDGTSATVELYDEAGFEFEMTAVTATELLPAAWGEAIVRATSEEGAG